MTLRTSLFIIAALIACAQQKTYTDTTPVILGASAAATAALVGTAAYLEWQSIKDTDSKKQWNRAGWTAAASFTGAVPTGNLLTPASWYCMYKSVEGDDWAKRFICKIAARLAIAPVAHIVNSGIAIAKPASSAALFCLGVTKPLAALISLEPVSKLLRTVLK